MSAPLRSASPPPEARVATVKAIAARDIKSLLYMLSLKRYSSTLVKALCPIYKRKLGPPGRYWLIRGRMMAETLHWSGQ